MDALHIACSYVLQERAVLTAGMLLDHDRDVVQLLQPGKSAAISMGAADGVVVQDPHTRATQLVVQVIATCVMCQNVPILTRLIQLPAAQDIGKFCSAGLAGCVHQPACMQRHGLYTLTNKFMFLLCSSSPTPVVADRHANRDPAAAVSHQRQHSRRCQVATIR